MNTNKTVEMVFKKMCVLVFWMRVASALEGLTLNEGYFILSFFSEREAKLSRGFFEVLV